ncbi:unnamed protein product [Acanthoscelides obtectus]|uniref:Cyclin-dependent kinase 20 n=1 Tax=Acanthoscelides obtectus TaxID=200917 RepID=A0A9P0LDU5_ACAOB|nr:unnamed protein product [Acanthoscelides obtectus]CAK1638671.1 Cyclin-dependent kinase 20 [Acanthoscelides obtectus]
MNNYKLIGRAGEGAHGFVFKGLDLRTQKYVALKKVAVNPNVGIPKNIFREICSLRVLKFRNIVKLIEVTSMGSSVILVMEYLPWSLADVLKNYDKSLTLSQIKTYSKMMLNGIDYIHQNHIMHRGETDIEQLAIVLDTLGTPNDETWPELKELPDYNKIVFTPSTPKSWRIILSTADSSTVSLISKILIYNGIRRLTAREALKHEFFRNEPYPCKLSKMPKLKNEAPEMTWNFADFDECLEKLEKK